ncbi:MAG TPA: hypothetical protein VLA73_10290 [Burkholderiales bacterium]|nr:hypothetical protein [Burkholderiales bacterium]
MYAALPLGDCARRGWFFAMYVTQDAGQLPLTSAKLSLLPNREPHTAQVLHFAFDPRPGASARKKAREGDSILAQPAQDLAGLHDLLADSLDCLRVFFDVPGVLLPGLEQALGFSQARE